eukprot:TRINITY_DN2712_c0_g1_i1.p1 TRINITY_DN2712_c0_g1~~TRINITY_DN2712_c0_g1_i1.p1  ORF type:complete len:217 (-),score=66.96 TRINITY_DN2712_c0_g1_i1:240-890(-)
MGGKQSSSGSKKVGSKDKAILDMKVQRDKLHRYRTQVATVVEKETESIQQLLRENRKKNALLVLKKKKYQEGLLEKTDQQILNLEQLISEIEHALVEQKVVESLKIGNSMLQQIHKEINLEDVQKLMDDTADAIAFQKELDGILSQQLGGVSDDDILEELEALEQEMGNAAGVAEIPDAPSDPLPEISTSSQQTASNAQTLKSKGLAARPKQAVAS